MIYEQIRINASASFNGSDTPVVRLLVDGEALNYFTIVSNNTTWYDFGSVAFRPDVAHQISISYPNHTTSAQLVTVDALQIGRAIVSAHSPVEEYVSARGTIASTSQMYESGQLNFNLGKNYFHAAGELQPSDTESVATQTLAATPTIMAVAPSTESLAVVLSEDGWQGDAHAVVQVDGATIFSGYVAAARESAGQTVSLGSFVANKAHVIAVMFDNDAYGGTAATDRNLYVQAVTVNGVATGGSAVLTSNGTSNLSVVAQQANPTPLPTSALVPASMVVATPTPIASSTESFAVVLSEDAWQGDAHATVQVDGATVFSGDIAVPYGRAGQTVSLGSFASNTAHVIAVTFDNDAYGGTATTDRNLYVQSVTVNGVATSGSAALTSNGTSSFTVVAQQAESAAPSTPAPAPMSPPPSAVTAISAASENATIVLSEDAWQGDAHAIVQVDGTTIFSGNVVAPHGSAGQTISLGSLADSTAHVVTVTFDNDAYGGTVATDRNLYVQSVTVNGVVTGSSAALTSNGTSSFTVLAKQAISPLPAPPPLATPVPVPAPAPVTPPSPVSSYYLAVTGNDSGDGSIAHPFATLQHAASVMAGSAIKNTIIQGGSYSQTLSLGSADSDESFTGASGQGVTLNAAGQASLITINGGNNLEFSGMRFSGSTAAAISVTNSTNDLITNNSFAYNQSNVLLQQGSDHISVTNNLMANTSFSGIEMKDGTNFNIIDSNDITGIGPVGDNTYGGAIYVHGSSNDQITHNSVSNTAGAGINLSDFYTAGTGTQNLDDTIAYNTLTNTNISSSDSGAIYVLGRSLAQTNTTIKMNVIDGTGSASQHSVGIYLDDNANGVTVSQNIVRNVGSDGIQVHGGSNNIVIGNILDLGTGHPSAFLFQANPSDQPNPSPLQNNTVLGNIVISESAAPGAFYVNLAGGNPTISGNDYFNTTGTALIGDLGTRAIYENPDFADASTGNYVMFGAAGIGFQPINQSLIGLMPVGLHAY